MEIWKLIDGFGHAYAVSNIGRVKSFDRLIKNYPCGVRMMRGKVLKCSVDAAGYRRADLKNSKNKRKNSLVHRLVAFAFIENPHGKPHINHIDGNKTNNNPSNLEWCTHQENMKHGYDNGLIPRRPLFGLEKAISAKLTNKQAVEIKKRIANGESNIDIAKDYPVTTSAISAIKTGITWVF